jgi:flagellar basal-body rod modification protein FlgD
MSTAISGTASDPYAGLNGPSATKTDDASKASADRFLKMLVTQLQNQDPLNPMDNAQITSQMAQINAVTGLEKVNESVQALGGSLLQMQALQGAALVGREVTVEGNGMAVRDGVGKGAMVLSAPAGAVNVEVLDGANRVVGTMNLGALDGGVHHFEWDAGSQPNGIYTFRVAANQGSLAIPAQPLMVDRVQSVSASGNSLTMLLAQLGMVPASHVVTFN